MSEDMRVRHRYTDLIMREKARENALTRIKVSAGAAELFGVPGVPGGGNPMLQTLHGGAAAGRRDASNALDD